MAVSCSNSGESTKNGFERGDKAEHLPPRGPAGVWQGRFQCHCEQSLIVTHSRLRHLAAVPKAEPMQCNLAYAFLAIAQVHGSIGCALDIKPLTAFSPPKSTCGSGQTYGLRP